MKVKHYIDQDMVKYKKIIEVLNRTEDKEIRELLTDYADIILTGICPLLCIKLEKARKQFKEA